MGDQEFEDLVGPAHFDAYPDPNRPSAINYKLVHALTPLDENKSFLEKVHFGGLLCDIQDFFPSSSIISAATDNNSLLEESPESVLLNRLTFPLYNKVWSCSDEDDSDLELDDAYCVTRRPAIRWQDTDGQLPLEATTVQERHCGGVLKTSRISTAAAVDGAQHQSAAAAGPTTRCLPHPPPPRRRKLPELPKDRKPLQKIRQASLLEELREACSKNKNSSSSSSFLQSIAESQDPPALPPAFILNLVKAEDLESALHNNKSKDVHHNQQQQQHQYQRAAPNLCSGNDSGNSTSHSPAEETSRHKGLKDSWQLLPENLDLLDATHRGLHRFIPRHSDEIEIDIGDPIYVQREAEDLWCEGANLRTRQLGIFPLAHVVDVDYDDFSASAANNSCSRKERYLLQYIGSVETSRYKGTQVLFESVRKILGAKQPPNKHACVLEISDKGIKMMDKSRRVDLSNSHPSQDYFYNLKNVTFCGFHPSSSQYFGFVTKHPRLPKYACHVFLGEGSTQHIAEACGRAFSRFYQKFIETAYPVEDIYLE